MVQQVQQHDQLGTKTYIYLTNAIHQISLDHVYLFFIVQRYAKVWAVIVKKVIAFQLHSHMTRHNTFEELQSAYKAHQN